MTVSKGKLYVVATPIGNLADITARAVEVLGSVSLVAAEDTRHSKRLLDHLGIKVPLVALHDHNEATTADELAAQMTSGKSVALISDAGTPLVSDPGFRLVRACIACDIEVTPIPGPSAVIAALSAAGLATDRFCFEGFLPAKSAGRRARLEALRRESRTLIFFEAPHRVATVIDDMREIAGGERAVTLARELTKQYEQIWRGTLADAAMALAREDILQKGEFVIVLEGAPLAASNFDERELMETLLSALPPATAASIASRLTGGNKRHLYDIALSLKKG